MTQVIINAEITSFGKIHNLYKDKILLNKADKCVDISPILQDEDNEEAVYLTLDKRQCLAVAAILKTFAKSL